jgi:hypothetical protein
MIPKKTFKFLYSNFKQFFQSPIFSTQPKKKIKYKLMILKRTPPRKKKRKEKERNEESQGNKKERKNKNRKRKGR